MLPPLLSLLAVALTPLTAAVLSDKPAGSNPRGRSQHEGVGTSAGKNNNNFLDVEKTSHANEKPFQTDFFESNAVTMQSYLNQNGLEHGAGVEYSYVRDLGADGGWDLSVFQINVIF